MREVRMTRKHYIALAEIIRQAEKEADPREYIARRFAIIAKQDNGNFNQQRFLNACNV